MGPLGESKGDEVHSIVEVRPQDLGGLRRNVVGVVLKPLDGRVSQIIQLRIDTDDLPVEGANRARGDHSDRRRAALVHVGCTAGCGVCHSHVWERLSGALTLNRRVETVGGIGGGLQSLEGEIRGDSHFGNPRNGKHPRESLRWATVENLDKLSQCAVSVSREDDALSRLVDGTGCIAKEAATGLRRATRAHNKRNNGDNCK